MLEADYQLTAQAHDQVDGGGRFLGDETLLVKFFKKPKQNPEKSLEKGRPIYDEATYINIVQPGNKDTVVERVATEEDKRRFHRHWQAFQNRTSQDVAEGTPLSEWPAISRAMVEELSYFNVKTVEQLIGMSDSNGQNIRGINNLKRRAQAFLDVAEDSAKAEEIVDLKEKNESLEERIAQLEAALSIRNEDDEDEDDED